jgi:hypothetical protein
MNEAEKQTDLQPFLLALLSFFTTATTLDYINYLDERLLTTLWAQLWLIVQWFVVGSMILRASSRAWVVDALHWWRVRPLVLWLAILVATPSILILLDLLSAEAPLPSEYVAWNVLWLGYVVFFVGIKQGEYRAMAHRVGTSRLTGILISLTTLVIMAIGAEVSLRTWLVFSNGYATGSIHAEWVYRYWNPLNELQFRDYDIYRDIQPAQERVMVLGDSFAAGIGVNDIDDTFPQLLGDKLGENYAIYNVSHAGWNTNQQIEGIINYPFEPDILVYSYFLNDASYVSPMLNNDFFELFPPPEGLLFDLVGRFHLADFLYWNVYTQYLRAGNFGYGNLVMDVYRDDLMWARHQGDIKAIVDWTRNEADADVVVLLWPVLTQVEDSREITSQVADYFAELNVPVIDMGDYVADAPVIQRIANPFDMHPSAWSHQIAAEALYQALQDNGIVPISSS